MNLAQGSTGSMSHWRFLETFGETFKPPLVIWQFFVNDFNEDYQLAVTRGEITPFNTGPTVPDYPDSGGPVVQWLRENSVGWVVLEIALFGEDAYISDFERFHFTRPYSVSYNGHVLNFGQNYEQIATNMEDPRIYSGVGMTRDALQLAKQAVEGWGGELVVILIPTREEVYRPLTAPLMGEQAVDKLGDPRRVMDGLCMLLSLTCLDMLPTFQSYAESGEHLYYTEDMHLNPRGNQILADEVVKWLRMLRLVPPA
jgi:hypothetical protein